MGDCWSQYWSCSLYVDSVFKDIRYHEILGTDNSLFGLFREDSLRKVYFIPSYDTVEEIIFDFSLGVGDTLFSGGDYFTVVSIDTPLYFGVPRRTMHMVTSPFFGGTYAIDRWIEGIGSTFVPCGLLAYNNAFFYAPLSTGITNIYLNGTIAFTDTIREAICEYPNGTAIDETTPGANLLYSPNPAGSELTIQLPGTDAYFIQVFDAVGQQVTSERPALGSKHFNLSLGQLSSGIYFLKVTASDGSSAAGQFVKLN